MTPPSRDLVTQPAALAVPQTHAEVIRQSHRRSAALGLSRGERLPLGPMMRSDLGVARERNQRLCIHAAPVMQVLFEQIVNTESMIVLTDAHGTILHSVGDDDFLERASKVALAPGENWAEHAKGTNAIGTTLFEEKPTLVHAGEHFIHANSFLTCSAAPIFDPRGHVLGVLDVTGDHRGYHQHTMGLVRMSARMIENHWLSDDYNNRLRLHFHSRPEFIGTLLEGIVAVAPDGKVLGGNRSALDQLGLSGSLLRAQTLGSLFGTSVGQLVDHFRMPLATPLCLVLPSGQQLYASARFDWHSQPVLGGLPQAAEEARRVESAAPTSIDDAATAEERSDTDMPGSEAELVAPAVPDLHALCTGDPQVERLVQQLRRVIHHDIPLLILGETGSGKERLARAVHQESARARGPFVAVNCATLPESLLEAELFGCADGANPGARRDAVSGRIAQAHGGTLFLDEIGELPLPLQTRLLQVVQDGRVTPPGGSQTRVVDIAVIAATQHKLRERVQQQSFREDLYQRLNGLAVRLPPLRERSDLEALAHHIVHEQRPADPPVLSESVLELFRRYSWPGNIRQLSNVLRTAALLSAGESTITTEHLSDDFLEEVRHAAPQAAPAHATPASSPAPPKQTLEEVETELIRSTLQALGGNISATSKQLGISRNTIYRKLRWNTDKTVD